jgi:hypothetical protein
MATNPFHQFSTALALKATLLAKSCQAALLALLLLAMCLPARAEDHTPPLRWPVELNQPGTLIDKEVRIDAPRRYAISLYFYITMPSRISPWLDRQSAEEARQIYAILRGPVKGANGNWHEAGVPGRFKIRVVDRQTGAVLCDQDVYSPNTLATHMGRAARLVELPLTAGSYVIRVDALSVEPELAPLHSFVSLAPAHHGK